MYSDELKIQDGVPTDVKLVCKRNNILKDFEIVKFITTVLKTIPELVKLQSLVVIY